jgi:alpha-mannosidase
MKTRILLSTIIVLLLGCLGAGSATAHRVYLMNDNHTDYGWNATTAEYDTSMLSEIDFYLDEIDRTSANPSAEQARFNADCWWYLYLYENNRTPQQFQRLINAMKSGHITIPLNPFVTLYGAIPTEAAIRAGYYPGRIERQYGVSFRLAQNIENHTNPWGLSSLWAGSGIYYTWKGVCNCATDTPIQDRTEEVFRWQGPDDKELLMKWYQIEGTNNKSWGGYAEARANLSQNGIQAAIDRFSSRWPFLPMTGLFGAGWDDVYWESAEFVDIAQQWNASNSQDEVIVSNGIDYFEELEGFKGELPILRGGWGNDWDLWPAALTEPTAITRRAVEQLRTAEALSVLAQWSDQDFWGPLRETLEQGFNGYFKYFEHGWDTVGGLPLQGLVDNKLLWSDSFKDSVTTLQGAAYSAVAALFTTPDEDRFVVFNPLSFERTDVADLPWSNTASVRVVDLATGEEVASQPFSRNGQTYIRILAKNIPSMGYRTYRVEIAQPAVLDDAATITGNSIENERYRVELGPQGQIISAVDKFASKEIAGSGGLNDFGSGTAGSPAAENPGPVSTTIMVDVAGTQSRRVRVTLFKEIDRIEIEDEILDNITSVRHYRFDVALTDPQIRFEEIGAIARPGLSAQVGDFLPGTRAEYMTLNHFVSFEKEDYNIVVSNWDAFTMRVGQSTPIAFDLPTSEVSVLAVGNPSGFGIQDQGGENNFRHRFAVLGDSGAGSPAQAMRISLAHQNPLIPIRLPRNQVGPLTRHVLSLLSLDAENVLVTAFKPAEEPERGMVLRLWELDDMTTTANIDLSTFQPTEAAEVSLIETDVKPLTVSAGKVAVSLEANEIKTIRFIPIPFSEAALNGPKAMPGILLLLLEN